jgi:hypothetical protein
MNRFLVATKCLTLLSLSWWTVCWWTVCWWTVCWAGSPWVQVAGQGVQGVGRATNDREADLIDALVRGGRFDDAEAICKSRLQGAVPHSDASAKWTIRHSQILTARQMGSETFEDADVERAQQPTVDLMKAYPGHRRQLFLEAQNLAVEREAAVHNVLRAAVSPATDTAREIAFQRLLRTTTAVLALADRIGDSRSQLESEPAAREFALVADLVRLQQELQVDAVSMALMQTELFPAGSDDCIAAATKAEQAADEAIAKLPSGTAARREVERLKVEAIFRAGQLGRAEAELGNLLRTFGEPLPPRVAAMQIRIDVANQNMPKAQARLAAFYGDAPKTAPRSIEMDLARLDFLMRSDQGSEVGAWLDVIEQRGGAYARRRAEAISLASLRATGNSPARPQMVDPSLIAAQGQDWLRRGNPGRGGDLLSAAAAAESDPDRAIRHASEAAAALISANRKLDAAQVLTDVSISKPTGANAAAAHLQAAILISTANLPDEADRIETLLRANVGEWPASEAAPSAREWLLKLLTSQARHVDAAEVATQIPIEQITREDADHAVGLWRIAFRSSPEVEFAETTKRFQHAFRPLLEREDLRASYVTAATLLLDRDSLSALPSQASEESFVDALRKFRQTAKNSGVLQSPPADLVEDVIWRLMRDGRTYPQNRKLIVALIGQWVDPATASIEQAERLLWNGQIEESITMLRGFVGESPTSVHKMKQAAELLGSSESSKSREAAIQFWDQLAAGTAQGSRTWHEAKLAAIGLLRQSGKKADAQRRAKYILLTTPNIDSALQQQYEAAIK